MPKPATLGSEELPGYGLRLGHPLRSLRLRQVPFLVEGEVQGTALRAGAGRSLRYESSSLAKASLRDSRSDRNPISPCVQHIGDDAVLVT
jgi:hypothetical protein